MPIPFSSGRWQTHLMNAPSDLSQLSPDQLRHLAAAMMSQVEQQGQALQAQEQALAQSQKTLRHTEEVNQKLTYELALLKRHAFGKRSEQLNVLQISLLDEKVVADIAAIETELEDLAIPGTPPATKKTLKRAPFPLSYRAPRSIMIRRASTVSLAANGGELAKRSARNSITHWACST
ncbi:transposase [Halomonas sp. 18H]|nr:transposase [Halomonas sp. 18H]MCW4153858.1 transposase [Halomonas sp. 18H]